jgi:hypothetical protein
MLGTCGLLHIKTVVFVHHEAALTGLNSILQVSLGIVNFDVHSLPPTK